MSDPITSLSLSLALGGLHHLHESVVQPAVRQAVIGMGIPKGAGCHTFRYSFATHLLEYHHGVYPMCSTGVGWESGARRTGFLA